MDKNANKNVVLFIAAVGSFLTPFMSSSVVIALPAIGRDLAMGTDLLNWVASSFLLAAAICVVPFGRLSDIYGRKRIYLYGIVMFSLSTVLCGVSISAAMLIVFRVLQGISSAMIFSTGVAILTSVFPAGQRGKVLGINVAVVYLGLAVGPFVGGFLTQYLGWRSIFFINIPIEVAAIIAILLGLKQEWTDAKGEKFDMLGSIVYGLGLLGIMSGLSITGIGVWRVVLALAGVAAIVAFGVLEMKTDSPVLKISLFKNNRVLSFSSLAALINYSATFAVSYLVSLYLQYVRGFSPKDAGLILMVQPAVQAFFSPLAGKLSDRIEPQKVASAGMAISVAGLMVFTFLNSNTYIMFLVAGLMTLGLGLALFSSPNTNAIMSSVAKEFYGVTSGIVGTARLIGQTLSMGVVSLIFALYIGRVQITQQYSSALIVSTKIVFTVFAVLCFIGIFASLARGSIHVHTEGDNSRT